MRPLEGLRIVEFEGIGPGPLAGRMLADHGAEVIAVVRPNKATLGNPEGGRPDPLRRGKRVVSLDLKAQAGVAAALALVERADALIEGNRPGVMERLGLGPADCARVNPKLVYGRMTGWGQDGPLASVAGHDLNYIAPSAVGDAGGALGLAFGVVSAVFAASRTGQGAVIDCSIVDMTAALSGVALWAVGSGMAGGPRPSIFHDSPFYDCYRCADGRYVTIGALEPQFYALLLEKLGLADVDAGAQYDMTQWPALKARFAALFASRSSREWSALLEGTDVCFAPVLIFAEGAAHPHLAARGTYRMVDGALDAAPAPRFSPLGPAAKEDS